MWLAGRAKGGQETFNFQLSTFNIMNWTASHPWLAALRLAGWWKWKCLDMRISEHLGVKREQSTVKDACSSHNDLVGRIAMERAGQLRGLYGNTRSKCQELNASIRECNVEPLTDRTRKGDALKLHEFGDLPAGNRADANSCLLRIQVGPQSGRKTRIVVDPPNPNVRVEHDHRLLRRLPVVIGDRLERADILHRLPAQRIAILHGCR